MLAFALMPASLIDGSPRFVYLSYALHRLPITLLIVSINVKRAHYSVAEKAMGQSIRRFCESAGYFNNIEFSLLKFRKKRSRGDEFYRAPYPAVTRLLPNENVSKILKNLIFQPSVFFSKWSSVFHLRGIKSM